ncbi:hypothetical protein [Streptacidiphilus cavernicola]|uniref:Ig-like domain-containing protein n=1 Tax=Streptacidiphilus cavernicola TaxID=3342716 RepID=A0ABV6VXK2_9ACTN
MAFTRSSEPFQEPPEHRSRWLLATGIAALLVFFVPLLVIIAMGQNSTPAQATSTTQPRAAVFPQPRLMPPLPPPGAPWPPPPGAPVPPVCTLEYRVDPGGATSWTGLITLGGTLATSASVPAKGSRPDTRQVPVGVEAIALPAALARDHGLRAVLTTGSGSFDCLVGPQS